MNINDNYNNLFTKDPVTRTRKTLTLLGSCLRTTRRQGDDDNDLKYINVKYLYDDNTKRIINLALFTN